MAWRDYLSRKNMDSMMATVMSTGLSWTTTTDHGQKGETTRCYTCNDEFDSSSRIVGSTEPARCPKCSNSKSIYQMLCEPPRYGQPHPRHEPKHGDGHGQGGGQGDGDGHGQDGHRGTPPKKLRYLPEYLREIQLPTPPPSVSPIDPADKPTAAEPIAVTTGVVQPSRKRRRSLSLTTQGAVRIDDRHQRQLVATRDIAEGEIILRESPIVGGPMAKDFFVKKKLEPDGKQPVQLKFQSICLTCCKNVQTNYKCTKCGFPMCNLTCQQHPDHADFECQVFATNPVDPIMTTNEYKKIKLLRCLLLREKDPDHWQKIIDMDPHDDIRSGNFCAVSTSIALCKFIQQECHLKQYDVETINRVVGINTVHSMNTWNPAAYPITETKNNEITKATLLFYKAGLLAHDCRPNTRIVVSQTGIGTENFIVTVIASVAISKGQLLTTCPVDVTIGTFQRRSELLESYYLSCTCRRCMDPDEHSTFFSALKCPKCPTGQLLPGNPLSLDLSSVWLCNLAPRCDFIIVASQVMDLLRTVQQDVENAAVEHSLFQEYQNLQKVLGKYRGKILHKNHFYIMNIQYGLIMVINQLLEIVNEEEALKLSHQQISLCRSCIDVVDVLRPGNNRIRGNLLYFFHEGLLMTFLVEAKRRMSEPESDFAVTGRKQFEDILNIMKIGRECLISEPPGSPEFARAQKLSLETSGLQPLIRYFNIKVDASS